MRRMCGLFCGLSVLGVFAPGLASAQVEPLDVPKRERAPITADLPGFANSASTVEANDVQVELGLDATKVTGAPLSAGLSLLTRYGMWDGAELRVAIPRFALVFEQETVSIAMQTIEGGMKLSFDLGESAKLGLIPYLVVPADPSDEATVGFGGGAHVIVDVSLGGGLALNAQVTPRYQQLYLTPDTTEGQLQLDAALGLGFAVSDKMGMFVEGVGQLAGDQLTTLLNLGLTADLGEHWLFVMQAGVGLSEPRAIYGGPGIVWRM